MLGACACAGLDLDPPVISLALDEAALTQYDSGSQYAGFGCSGVGSDPKCRARGQGAGLSNEDYSKTCAAKAADADSCPLPVACSIRSLH